jgi:tetratricopeptide (TPR) repeat protein
MAYYQMALLEPDREFEYLKKAISINPDFKDAWIDLARVSLKNDNIDKAISYLRIAKYIDNSDYRYYYYLGLILKDRGLRAEAKQNSEHSLKLNPDYDIPKKDLNI